MAALTGINRIALDSFDLLASGGVTEPTNETDRFIAAFESTKERDGMIAELEGINSAGQPVEFSAINGSEARNLEPALSDKIAGAVLLKGQRYLNPGAYADSLAQSVEAAEESSGLAQPRRASSNQGTRPYSRLKMASLFAPTWR